MRCARRVRMSQQRVPFSRSAMKPFQACAIGMRIVSDTAGFNQLCGNTVQTNTSYTGQQCQRLAWICPHQKWSGDRHNRSGLDLQSDHSISTCWIRAWKRPRRQRRLFVQFALAARNSYHRASCIPTKSPTCAHQYLDRPMARYPEGSHDGGRRSTTIRSLMVLSVSITA